MRITAIFDVKDMTAAQYDSVMADLEKMGAGTPAGRLYHAAAAKPDGWLVVDIWESPAHLDKFAQTLMPVLVQNGVTPPQPQVYPTHNIVA